MILNNKLLIVKRLLQNIRQLHCPTLSKYAYDGPGKTTINIINHKDSHHLLIDSCSPLGFKFSDGTLMLGSVALFPKTMLCWKVKSAKEINGATLSLFTTLDPQPDIVILGLETDYEFKSMIEMKKALIEKNISVEILPVHKACGAFNFLNEEGRYVVAGLIPPLERMPGKHKQIESSAKERQNEKAIEAK